MKKPRRKTRKPIVLEDLPPEVAKMHFHTDGELMAIVEQYAREIGFIVKGKDRRQMAHDLKRITKRMLDLVEELQ